MIILSKKHYNELVNNMYNLGYKQGYENGKKDVVLANLTPNEIRKILGIGLPPKEEKETQIKKELFQIRRREELKYYIRTVDLWPHTSDDCRKILREYPCLNEFRFEPVSSDKTVDAYIHLNTVDDITKLIGRVGKPIIMFDDPPTIEIYDEYRE